MKKSQFFNAVVCLLLVATFSSGLLWAQDLKNNSALEIGTSTGHSGIWIAWALSKTGGKLITLNTSGVYKTMKPR